MHAELQRSGHPMLAAVLTVSLTGGAWAESAAPKRPAPAPVEASQELELLKEEETVSIASRYEQPISRTPSNVYVITDEDIRQSGATDIPTILRRVPGLEVIQTTGGNFDVSMRGNNQLGSNKLLLMVDGRSIYVDVGATVLWKMLPITLPEIKRIEVLKGPASATYGFNAFDGIINIITKSPEEMTGTTVQFGGGELGTISSAAIHAGTIGNLGYRLSIGRDQNQQWRDHDALSFRSHKFNLQTEYHLRDQSRVVFSGGLIDVNRYDSSVSQDTFSPTAPAQGHALLAYERSDFFIRGYWNRFTTTGLQAFNPVIAPFLQLSDRAGTSDSLFSSDTYNIDVQHTLHVLEAHRLTYGANYRQNTVSSNLISEFTRENRLGFFLQDEWTLSKQWMLVAGVRYDMDSFINPTISPRAALIYSFSPDHTLRASGSVAYRPSTPFDERIIEFATTTFPSPATVIQGNRGLQPEQIVSYEVEYQGWFIKHRLRFRADVFFNHISDLISTRDLSANVATPVNDSGSADIYGGEAGIEFLATKWLSGFANYTYQEIGQSFTGRVQRAAPRHKFNLGFRTEFDNGVNGEILFHHYGSATYPPGQSFTSLASAGLVQLPDPRVGSYNLLNLRAGYRFWQEKAAAGYMRDAEVAVSVFNALNDEHREHPLGDLIGRRVMGWLTLRF